MSEQPTATTSSAGPTGSGSQDCQAGEGELLVRRGAPAPLAGSNDRRVGLQYLITKDPATMKIMLMAAKGTQSNDVKAGDALTWQGLQIAVRKVCSDAVVLKVTPAS